MKRAVRAEWTKLRTLPSTAWLAAAIVVLTVGLGAATTASVDTSRCPTVSTCFEDTVELALGGVALGQAAIVILAVAAVTNEHGNGLVATTLAGPNPSTGVLVSLGFEHVGEQKDPEVGLIWQWRWRTTPPGAAPRQPGSRPGR